MVRLSAPKLRAKRSLIIRHFLHAPTAKAERQRSPFAPAGARKKKQNSRAANGRQPRHIVTAVAKRNSKKARHLRLLSPKMSFATHCRPAAKKIAATRAVATTYDFCRQNRITRQTAVRRHM
jgi:hypothetical protein